MLLVVVLLAAGCVGEDLDATTKTYDIQVPGSDPIRIIEAEPLWSSRSLHNSNVDNDHLQHFLSNYADDIRKQHDNNNNNNEKLKSWDVLPYQKHHHPYEDNKGWVSMEPVPWSISKISKWQSNYKPTPKPWDDYDNQDTHTHKPWNRPSPNYDVYYNKPAAIYNQKVQVQYPHKYDHKHTASCKHDPLESGEIITDGLPSNFPQPYESNRRRGTDLHSEPHQFSDGEWVLLSTTKGYKYPPQRQRSLQINPDALGAHRGVRLTVLPPLKNSKVNMTTSHGGLLQVESTFETVEEAHKQHKKQKAKRKKSQMVVPTLTTTRRNTAPDSSAVLAAVGAGMIPATMAMLVPMALGGRKRRDAAYTTTTPKYLQLTPPYL